MLFNVEKCKVMHIGANKSNVLYSMGNITLSEISEENDLGVIFTNDLKAVSNCGEVVKKENRILEMIKRNFRTKVFQLYCHYKNLWLDLDLKLNIAYRPGDHI